MTERREISDAEILEAAEEDPRNRPPQKSFWGRLLGKYDSPGIDHWVPGSMLRELDAWAQQAGVTRATAVKLLIGKGLAAETARRSQALEDHVARIADRSVLNQSGNRIL